MSLWKHYHIAESIPDALAALISSPSPVSLVAGGTDLLLELDQGHRAPVASLVDVTRIPELTRLEIQDGQLFIGAAVPVSTVSASRLVREHAQAVAEGCDLIGGPQVRNAATLGGNVAHALPAADGMIGLVALDSIALVADKDGIHPRSMLSLFRGPGQSTLEPGKELLVGFQTSLGQTDQASAFKRIMRPQGVALPILNLAVWLERDESRIRKIRVAIGPAGPTPQRAGAVEEFLTNVDFNPANLAGASTILRATMRFRTSPFRASAEYRYHIIESLFIDTITTAWERSGMKRSLHDN